MTANLRNVQLPGTLNILNKFSREPLTGADFVELCEANQITVKLTNLCDRGLYYCTGGRHYIAISSRLKRAERRFVAWHEFAHFLQNYHRCEVRGAFSDVVPDQAAEKLADVFAAIAIDPDRVRITGPRDFINMLLEEK